MGKRLLLASFGLAALLVVAPPAARPSAYTIEPCLKSKLCTGLVEHFNMNDLSDYGRYGAFGSVLHERIGSNIGSAAGKIGNAVDLAGTSTSYLWSSTFVPTMSMNWSASFWFKADTLPSPGTYATFISRSGGNNAGTSISLYNNAGTTKVRIYTWDREATTKPATDSSTTIVAGTWYFVAAGVGDPDEPGLGLGTQQWVSVNGGTKQTTDLNYIPRSGLSHLRVGQTPSAGKAADGGESFDGLLDELSFFGRSIGLSDITLLCNDLGSGCTGLTYPFVTE